MLNKLSRRDRQIREIIYMLEHKTNKTAILQVPEKAN